MPPLRCRHRRDGRGAVISPINLRAKPGGFFVFLDFLLDILPKYDMITKSCSGRKLHMGEFPSGQRGQTVNLLLIASVVRIHLPPPIKTHQLCWWVFIGGGRFVDSNPLKSNMPVACWQNQCKHWFSPYRFPSESGQSNPPSPYCATSFAGGSFAGGGRFVDSNPLESNMPVACWQNQCKHWFSDTFHTERSGSPASGKRVNKRICPWQRYLFL